MQPGEEKVLQDFQCLEGAYEKEGPNLLSGPFVIGHGVMVLN